MRSSIANWDKNNIQSKVDNVLTEYMQSCYYRLITTDWCSQVVIYSLLIDNVFDSRSRYAKVDQVQQLNSVLMEIL